MRDFELQIKMLQTRVRQNMILTIDDKKFPPPIIGWREACNIDYLYPTMEYRASMPKPQFVSSLISIESNALIISGSAVS